VLLSAIRGNPFFASQKKQSVLIREISGRKEKKHGHYFTVQEQNSE
jgi:hypothetical protein